MNIFLRYLLSIIILGGFWAFGSYILGENILPDPLIVLTYFYHSLKTQLFLKHAGMSFWRVSIGMMFAWCIAFPFGLYLGNKKLADSILSPIIFLTYPIPKIVLLPIFLTIFGLGELPKIFLISLTTGYQILIATRASALSLDKKYKDSFKSLDGTSIQSIRHVIIPATLPDALISLKISSGTATAVLFMVESFATQCGLGFLIMDGWGRGNLPQMYTGILAMSLLGMGIHEFCNGIERYLCRWKHLQAGITTS